MAFPAQLAQAADPQTSPGQLYTLARFSGDREIQAAVAKNPNASLATMAQLVGAFPKEVEANEGLMFAELTDGGDKDGRRTLRFLQNVLAKRTTNIDRLEFYAASPDESIRLGVAENENAPPSILVRLATDPAFYVRSALTRHPSTPAEALDSLVKEFPLHIFIAKHPNATEAHLRILALSSHPDVAKAAIAHQNTPDDVLLRLSASKEEYILRTLVDRPDLPAEALAQIGQYGYGKIRERVAEHPNTSTETLQTLLQDYDPHVIDQARLAIHQRKLVR